MAYIKAISYYLAENTSLAEETGKAIGVHEHPLTKENETASDLAIIAAKKLFKENNINPSDIDFVIFCTQTPDYYLPSSACLIQDKLGISTTAGAFDINLDGSGFIYGLALAKGFLASSIAKNVLLLTGDTLSKVFPPDDKNRLLYRDSATATLISDEGFAEIKNFSLGTDGNEFKNSLIKTRSARQNEKAGFFENKINDAPNDFFYRDGNSIQSFFLNNFSSWIKDIKKKNNILKDEQIHYYIIPQEYACIMDSPYVTPLIPLRKVHPNQNEIENLSSSTIPILLKDSIESKLIHKNFQVMMVGFGAGLSWGGTVLKF